MKTHLIMQASALYLGALGSALLFLPEEVARALGASESGALLALAGGPYLGIAALDWLGRNAVYGGIFGRPVILANLATGFVSAMVLLRRVLDGHGSPLAFILLAGFAVHAALFGWLLLRARVPMDTN